MKVLNIDALVAPKRSLELAGVKHEIVEISAQEFVDNLAAAEALEKAAKESDGGQTAVVKQLIANSIEQIRKAAPTLDAAVVGRLSIEAIGVISAFVRGELEPEVAAAASAATAATAEGSDAKKPT